MTSPLPLIFKKTRSKPAQRKRDASPEDAMAPGNKDEARNGAESAESPSALAARLKSKVKKNKAKSKLSFGGDDEVGEW
jgi:GC-rich sequence DNA-binding factor